MSEPLNIPPNRRRLIPHHNLHRSPRTPILLPLNHLPRLNKTASLPNRLMIQKALIPARMNLLYLVISRTSYPYADRGWVPAGFATTLDNACNAVDKNSLRTNQFSGSETKYCLVVHIVRGRLGTVGMAKPALVLVGAS